MLFVAIELDIVSVVDSELDLLEEVVRVDVEEDEATEPHRDLVDEDAVDVEDWAEVVQPLLVSVV